MAGSNRPVDDLMASPITVIALRDAAPLSGVNETVGRFRFALSKNLIQMPLAEMKGKGGTGCSVEDAHLEIACNASYNVKTQLLNERNRKKKRTRI